MIPKFRAWYDNKMWLLAKLDLWGDPDQATCDLVPPLPNMNELYDVPLLEVILMQSTGLKDLKGVEIFEGDVVWIIDKGETDNGWGWFEEVKFRNGSFMVGDDFLINSHHRCVVHGKQIYENPELLEES
ncbi:MAG TPA: YopX family protein [Candidatus Jeotgalibaca merdavium]|uniref:YopX family protein n=1 Tax=Candidatus Jeotgalibaca merdavium TaxID=2838627 RepID=A0A9D2HZN4_9LACT|nr:YopX family protein [Candidatus Jeotgalibaca merdavium]